MRAAREAQPGDVLTIEVGMLIVRDTAITHNDRVDHVNLHVATGRTDEGFTLTYPAFTLLDVYREGDDA